jgi:imidazolonepropionase-like amidohydrolase
MNAIVFRNATVLDVTAGCLIPGQEVLVEGTHITRIGQAVELPHRALTFDVAGRILMPGLCDAHVHVTASTADFAQLGRLSPTYVAAQSSHVLRSMLLRGFTTVRDAGGADHGLARALSEKLFVGPRLLFCGKAISQTGGHGDMRLPGEQHVAHCPCGAGLAQICDGVPEVRHACRDQIRQGATHIKLMLSGGVSSPTDRISSTQFSDDELAAAIEEASAAGLYCMAHAYTPRAIQRAVLAGVRSVEHGNLLDKETADLIRERGAFLVPTLVTYSALAREGAEAGMPASMTTKLAEVLERGLSALELAIKAHISLVFGTDLLGPMHRHQLEEFAIRGELQRPIDVIRSATLNAARLFKMEGQIGVIAPGAFADLLVVDGNPMEDLRTLQEPDKYLHGIMQRGEFIRCTD